MASKRTVSRKCCSASVCLRGLAVLVEEEDADADASRDGDVLDTKLTAFVSSSFGVIVATLVAWLGLKREVKLGIGDGRGWYRC